MTKIKVGGREIPLVFDMASWAQMEQEVCVLARLNEVLTYSKEERTNTNIKDMVSIVRILGNEGLECGEEKADLTDKWLMKSLRPSQFGDIRVAIISEIDAGMASEQNEKDPNAERDLVLEEINKKKQ